MTSKGEQRRLEMKNNVLKSNGVEIAPGLNDIYGGSVGDSASCYAGILRCAGCLPGTLCVVCSACGCGPVKKVEQGKMGMIIEFGRLKRKCGPGLHVYNPCTEKFILADLRVQSLNTRPQKLLTKDNVSVTLDVFVNYKIVIPEYTLYKCSNYVSFLDLAVQSVMKSIVSERTLTQLLVNRKEIEKSTTNIMDEQAHKYGIDVVSIETQSMSLPQSMTRAMAISAESLQDAKAKVLNAKGNLESSKYFRQAADEMGSNKISVELMYFNIMKFVGRNESKMIVSDSSMTKINRDKDILG